ncbi:Hypothetical predicted protein [Pelobates cultripes]|uniref:Uncharacterized protein n=1 Tax=Pelobates cultripes TaxID=61616 RepID=A0AAD1SYL5_PELCU|nr:Hypothetical predicted protein [Pelobates cultripes]
MAGKREFRYNRCPSTPKKRWNRCPRSQKQQGGYSHGHNAMTYLEKASQQTCLYTSDARYTSVYPEYMITAPHWPKWSTYLLRTPTRRVPVGLEYLTGIIKAWRKTSKGIG